MAGYYLAPSLVRFRADVNARWPQRDRTSDGWIGDTSHQARPSDHNPDWSAEAAARGVYGIVRAFDTDEDLDGNTAPGAGQARVIVDTIVGRRDPRIAYVIYEGRIISSTVSPWQWRPYTGPNAHLGHVHLSIKHTATAENDTRPWLPEDDMSAADVAAIKAHLDDLEAELKANAQAHASSARSDRAAATAQIIASLANITVDVDVDEGAVAQQIADALPDDLAAVVLDALRARLEA